MHTLTTLEWDHLATNDKPLAVESNPSQESLLSVDTTNASPPVSERWAAGRAAKYAYGTDKDLGDVQEALSQGQEKTFREGVAKEIDFNRQKAALYAQPFNAQAFQESLKETDPHHVFESQFANKLFTEGDHLLSDPESGSWYKSAVRDSPDEVNRSRAAGNQYLVNRELARRVYEDAQDNAAQQSNLSYGVDWLKGMVPLYTEIKERSALGAWDLSLKGEALE